MEYLITELNNLGYEDKYKKIYDEYIIKNNENFFVDKKDLLIISAILGVNNFSKKEIDKYKLENLRPLAVEFKDYYPIIYSIAICINRDIEVIFDKSKVSEIFNKCAGLGILKLKEILEKEGDILLRNYEDFLKHPEEYLNFNKYHNEVFEINEGLEEVAWL